MKLSIHFDERDEKTASEIAAVCDRLGVEYVLEERNDWMTRAVRPRSPEATHVLFVVSPQTAASWWLPFQIGRAVECRMPIMSFVTGLVDNRPRYLEAGEVLRELEDVNSTLRRLSRS